MGLNQESEGHRAGSKRRGDEVSLVDVHICSVHCAVVGDIISEGSWKGGRRCGNVYSSDCPQATTRLGEISSVGKFWVHENGLERRVSPSIYIIPSKASVGMADPL
jgi:hypothetical protein